MGEGFPASLKRLYSANRAETMGCIPYRRICKFMTDLKDSAGYTTVTCTLLSMMPALMA